MAKQVDLSQIPEENKHGDCFENALNTFLEKPHSRILVHATVMGQGNISGIRYVHAFVVEPAKTMLEDDTVIDMTLPKDYQRMPVGVYWWLGKVEDDVSYDLAEVRKNIAKYGTWGPWDKKLINHI